MGHTVVGRLLLGHTVRREGFGWGRQVIQRTAPEARQPVNRVRPHPRSQAPFCCLQARRWQHHRDGGRDLTELELTAHPVFHRSTGACHTSPSQPVMCGFGCLWYRLALKLGRSQVSGPELGA